MANLWDWYKRIDPERAAFLEQRHPASAQFWRGESAPRGATQEQQYEHTIRKTARERGYVDPPSGTASPAWASAGKTSQPDILQGYGAMGGGRVFPRDPWSTPEEGYVELPSTAEPLRAMREAGMLESPADLYERIVSSMAPHVREALGESGLEALKRRLPGIVPQEPVLRDIWKGLETGLAAQGIERPFWQSQVPGPAKPEALPGTPEWQQALAPFMEWGFTRPELTQITRNLGLAQATAGEMATGLQAHFVQEYGAIPSLPDRPRYAPGQWRYQQTQWRARQITGMPMAEEYGGPGFLPPKEWPEGRWTRQGAHTYFTGEAALEAGIFLPMGQGEYGAPVPPEKAAKRAQLWGAHRTLDVFDIYGQEMTRAAPMRTGPGSPGFERGITLRTAIPLEEIMPSGMGIVRRGEIGTLRERVPFTYEFPEGLDPKIAEKGTVWQEAEGGVQLFAGQQPRRFGDWNWYELMDIARTETGVSGVLERGIAFGEATASLKTGGAKAMLFEGALPIRGREDIQAVIPYKEALGTVWGTMQAQEPGVLRQWLGLGEGAPLPTWQGAGQQLVGKFREQLAAGGLTEQIPYTMPMHRSVLEELREAQPGLIASAEPMRAAQDIFKVTTRPVETLVTDIFAPIRRDFPTRRPFYSARDLEEMRRASPEMYQRIWQEGEETRAGLWGVIGAGLASAGMAEEPAGTIELSRAQIEETYSRALSVAAGRAGTEDIGKIPSDVLYRAMMEEAQQAEWGGGPIRLPGGTVMAAPRHLAQTTTPGLFEYGEATAIGWRAPRALLAAAGHKFEEETTTQIFQRLGQAQVEFAAGRNVMARAMGSYAAPSRAAGGAIAGSFALGPTEAYMPPERVMEMYGVKGKQRGPFMAMWEKAQAEGRTEDLPRGVISGYPTAGEETWKLGITLVSPQEMTRRGMLVSEQTPLVTGLHLAQALQDDWDGDIEQVHISGRVRGKGQKVRIAGHQVSLATAERVTAMSERGIHVGAGVLAKEFGGGPGTAKDLGGILDPTTWHRYTAETFIGEQAGHETLRQKIGPAYNLMEDIAITAQARLGRSAEGEAIFQGFFGVMQRPEELSETMEQFRAISSSLGLEKGGYFRGEQYEKQGWLFGPTGTGAVRTAAAWTIPGLKTKAGEFLLSPEEAAGLIAPERLQPEAVEAITVMRESRPGRTAHVEAFSALQRAMGSEAELLRAPVPAVIAAHAQHRHPDPQMPVEQAKYLEDLYSTYQARRIALSKQSEKQWRAQYPEVGTLARRVEQKVRAAQKVGIRAAQELGPVLTESGQTLERQADRLAAMAVGAVPTTPGAAEAAEVLSWTEEGAAVVPPSAAEPFVPGVEAPGGPLWRAEELAATTAAPPGTGVEFGGRDWFAAIPEIAYESGQRRVPAGAGRQPSIGRQPPPAPPGGGAGPPGGGPPLAAPEPGGGAAASRLFQSIFGVGSREFSQTMTRFKTYMDTWAERVNEAGGITGDFSNRLQKATKEMLYLQNRLEKAAGQEWGGRPRMEDLQTQVQAFQLGAVRVGGPPTPWGMLEGIEAAQYAETMESRLRRDGGGGGPFYRPPTREGGWPGGAMGQAAQGLQRMFSGWELMRLQRMWNLTGGPVFNQMIPAAAQAEMAGWQTGAQIGGWGAGLPGGVAGGVMQWQAAQAQGMIEAGRTGYRAWGGTMPAMGGLRQAQAIAGPAIGAGLVGGTLASTAAMTLGGLGAGVAATTVGLPVTAALAGVGLAYGGAEYMRSWGEPTAENQMALLGAEPGGWEMQRATMGRWMQQVAETRPAMGGYPGMAGRPAGATWAETQQWTVEQQQLAEQRAVTPLTQQAAPGRAATLNWMAQQLIGQEGTMWAGLPGGEQQAMQVLGQFAAYDPRFRTETPEELIREGGPPEWQWAMQTGIGPQQYQPMAQRMRLGSGGGWQLYQQTGMLPAWQQQQAMARYGQHAALVAQGLVTPQQVLGGGEQVTGWETAQLGIAQGPGLPELTGLAAGQYEQIQQGNQYYISEMARQGAAPGWMQMYEPGGMRVGRAAFTPEWQQGVQELGGLAGRMLEGIDIPGALETEMGGQVTFNVRGQDVSFNIDVGGQLGLQQLGTGISQRFQALGLERQERDLARGYLATTGRAAEGLALPTQELMGVFGGRGMWDIQDEQTALRHQYQMQQFGFQREQLGMQDRQFMERWGLGRQQMEAQAGWGAEDLQRRFQRQQVQFGWAEEDLAFRGATTSLQYAWGQEDIQESMRYATGRERRQLMRQEQRATVSYGMQMGQLETQEERLGQRRDWAMEDFERDKGRHGQRTQWARQSQDLSLRHHRQNMDLAGRRQGASEEYYEQQKVLQDEVTEKNRILYEEQFASQVQALQNATDQFEMLKTYNEWLVATQIIEEARMSAWGELVATGGALDLALRWVTKMGGEILSWRLPGGGYVSGNPYYVPRDPDDPGPR